MMTAIHKVPKGRWTARSRYRSGTRSYVGAKEGALLWTALGLCDGVADGGDDALEGTEPGDKYN